jgi:hypothetical protein
MKSQNTKAFRVVLVLQLLFYFLVLTKPDNAKCVHEVARHDAGALLAQIGQIYGINEYAYTVTDRVVYKQINSRITGRVVAVGILNTIVLL